MFERIMEQAAGRFGLTPDEAKQLLRALIGLIFNEKRGGSAGFLRAFRNQGLGDVVGSWLGGGPRQAISPAQLESVLGAGTLSGIASRLDLPQIIVSGAAAAMLPDVVGELGEDGNLPPGLPDRLRSWFGDIGGRSQDTGGWDKTAGGTAGVAVGVGRHKDGDMAGDALRAVGAGLDRADDAIGDTADAIGDTAAAARPGLSRRWSLLLFAAVVVAGFLLLRSC
jgi:uncharacterized protein YidB (DUF937 family)